MSSQLKGTGVALVTPFRADHTIDFRSLERLLEHTTEHGVDYFVVLGTTGEPATLSPEEKSAVLAFIKANNLEGISALLSVSPYYNKPSQEGIKLHYEKLANHSPAPIIMYNVPGRTSSNMTAETTLYLAAHPNIIGIKEASGDIAQAMKVAADGCLSMFLNFHLIPILLLRIYQLEELPVDIIKLQTQPPEMLFLLCPFLFKSCRIQFITLMKREW